jgi:Arc/MetJ family transcription regulator
MKRSTARPARYARRSFFVDDKAIARARKALGVGTNAEAVRLAVARVVELEAFWSFMRRSRGSLRPGSLEGP